MKMDSKKFQTPQILGASFVGWMKLIKIFMKDLNTKTYNTSIVY